MINNILADRNYTNNVNIYQGKNIYSDKQKTSESGNINDYFELSNSAKTESPNNYLMKFMHTIKASMNTDERVESVSYKYKEFYDDIIDNNNLSENDKNEKIQGLNYIFEHVLESIISQDVFVAKSNEIHDFLIADLNKYIIVNPDKEKHNNILKNHKTVTNYLNNIEKILKDYSHIFYESFISDIKNNSVDESFQNSLKKMKYYDHTSMSYDDAKIKAEELSETKTELYKHIGCNTTEDLSKDSIEEEKSLSQQIADYIADTVKKFKNGENEKSIPIGSCSFTEKEWEAFLKKFDILEAALKQAAKEELERRLKNKEYQENLKKGELFWDITKNLFQKTISENLAIISGNTENNIAEEIIDTFLTAQYSLSSFSSAETGKNNISYITLYTREGIFCRQAGQSSDYMWNIKFTTNVQYDKAMEFLSKFNSDDNLKFASSKVFWNDFINDSIDEDKFFQFFENMKDNVENLDNNQWGKYFIYQSENIYSFNDTEKKQIDLADEKIKRGILI